MSDKATDKRPQFILIEQEVIDNYHLDPYSGWLYAVIIRHADKKTGEAFPGITRLAELAHMSKPQVIRCIKKLEEAKLIKVERSPMVTKGEKREREVNHYHVLGVSGRQVQTLGVVSDREYPTIPQTLGVVSDVDSNQNHSEPESINHPTRKRVSLPSNIKMWQWKHVEQYASEHLTIDTLAVCGDAPMVKNLPTLAVARDCIELFEDLTRNGVVPHQYHSLMTVAMADSSTEKYSVFRRMIYALPRWLKTAKTMTIVPEKKANEFHYGIDMTWNGES